MIDKLFRTLNHKAGSAGFASGTLIHTKDGLKPIEDIKVGDWVLSWPEDKDPDLCKWQKDDDLNEYRQVTEVFVHDDQPVIAVNFVANGHREWLIVTPDHPVWVDKRGWVKVSEVRGLVDGDLLRHGNMGSAWISVVEDEGQRARVFNFTMDEYHTYFMGESGMWVRSRHTQSLNDIAP